MIKDLSKDLIKAVAGINQKSREAFVAEQRALQEKMAAKAMKMPKQPEPKADPAAHSGATDMAKKNMKAEAAEGSTPRNEKEKQLAKLHGNPNKITHGDVLKGRGVRREAWEDMLKAVKDRREREEKEKGTGKFNKKQNPENPSGTIYNRKSSTFDDGGKDADMKKADKKMKSEGVDQVDEMFGAEAEMQHHRLVDGKPSVPKRVGSKDIHLHHIGTGNSTGENAKYKVVAVGAKSPLKAKVGSTISGKKVNDHMDMSDKGGTVHVHTARPKAHFMDDDMHEERDTPGNSAHQCAIHVKSEQFGEGKTLFSQHAEPDADGNIAWYDVMFGEGIKRVKTEDLEILVSEGHMNHKKKKM